jgi:hypothetical protein
LKFIPDILKRKPKPELEGAAEKPSRFAALREKLRRKKPEAPAEETAKPAAEGESLLGLETLKTKLSSLVSSKNRSQKVNAVLVVTGAGIAVAGMAADMMFLGGVGTVTVISCLYSDLRNRQHIEKISRELSKIDDKIDEMKKAQQPVPDYAPALTAVKSSIEDFQASAKKVPPEVAAQLAQLKNQVTALQDKIAPANDDAAASKRAAGPSAP